MKIQTFKDKITSETNVDKLLSVELEYTVSSCTSRAQYLGPPFPREMWQEILSFFKWTYDTYQSESQVRLYVNTVKNSWKAWAYPQEARTGMTAKELDTPEANQQRSQLFKEKEGWLYFGTVHHHCSGSAFQSHVDMTNEQDQDGIHITVGKMDETVHDLHCRFYLKKNQFEPDMSCFWDIGKGLREQLPQELWDRVARYQMSRPGIKEFPKQWKDNVIEVKRVETVPWNNGSYIVGRGMSEKYWNGHRLYYDGSYFDEQEKKWIWPPKEEICEYPEKNTEVVVATPKTRGKAKSNDLLPVVARRSDAIKSLTAFCHAFKMSREEAIEDLGSLSKDMFLQTVVKLCKRYNIEMSDLYDELKWQKLIEEQAAHQVQLQQQLQHYLE